MKEIPLTKGQIALVDDADYEWLNQWKWCYLGERYAARWDNDANPRQLIYMHRLIMQTPEGMRTDHINLNKLDNRRNNLRIVTNSQNGMNIPKQPKRCCSSRYKGVSWSKKCSKWQAYITKNRKVTYIGLFTDEIEAARAYDVKAFELFGEFALPNFPLASE